MSFAGGTECKGPGPGREVPSAECMMQVLGADRVVFGTAHVARSTQFAVRGLTVNEFGVNGRLSPGPDI
jgi:hypothetical protein